MIRRCFKDLATIAQQVLAGSSNRQIDDVGVVDVQLASIKQMPQRHFFPNIETHRTASHAIRCQNRQSSLVD